MELEPSLLEEKKGCTVVDAYLYIQCSGPESDTVVDPAKEQKVPAPTGERELWRSKDRGYRRPCEEGDETREWSGALQGDSSMRSNSDQDLLSH